jgi:hypothetical protein
LEVRRWPQAVCSRSVSHRWMGCGTVDLPRCCQGLTGAGFSQTFRHQTAVVWVQVEPSSVSHAGAGRKGTAAHAAAPRPAGSAVPEDAGSVRLAWACRRTAGRSIAT